ncbi:MAG TPA: protein translocase subunit SecD [Steroidobacteraceae bacterium]|nr:protein translocase subunit SecD [Steroidobacteraceae bacterium]
MLEFPRWKYALVALVTLLALILALPNFFGTDPALQVARKNRAPMDDFARQAVEQSLTAHTAAFHGDYLDDGKLFVRFATVADQLKARDVVNEFMATDYISALTNASRAPEALRHVGLRPMPLGLDLRGGLYLLYQVDVNGAVAQLLESYDQGFRRILSSANLPFNDIVTYTSSKSTIPNALRVSLPGGTDVGAVRDALRKGNTDLTFSIGSDANGATIDMELSPTQVRARQDYALQKNITTLRNRVNEMGVSEPIVKQQGIDRINVQLPGVQNSAEVKDILGKVATLEFRLEDSQNSAAEAQQRNRAPLGSKLYQMEGRPVLLKRELIATGDQLTNATSSNGNEGPEVNVTLNGQGGDSMLRNTRLNVGRRMAVVYIEKSRETRVIDGQKSSRDVTTEKIISLATIRAVLSNQFRITGLSAVESRELALLMRSGSLSAPIFAVQESTIGPSLGAENIRKGVQALLIGMLAVFAFMALYYQRFGLVANLVLVANVVLLTALLSMLRATLSLPGIAGIILTVGIAVDANVLIYERIREELRNGVTPQAAIRAGFDKAFSAILDSNVTAFIAGLVLWVVGAGAIRGFAVVLTLGILTSMFTSLLGSRALITIMYGGRRKVTRLSIG